MLQEFLNKLYELALLPNKDKATDLIFSHIDDLCWASKWEEINDILRSVDLDKLDSNLMLSFLAITLCVSSKLAYRQTFYNKIERRLTTSDGPERTHRLLNGLVGTPQES